MINFVLLDKYGANHLVRDITHIGNRNRLYNKTDHRKARSPKL